MAESQSYKQFVNLNGVSVFQRGLARLERINADSKTDEVIMAQAGIRFMESMLIISEEEAELLINYLMRRCSVRD